MAARFSTLFLLFLGELGVSCPGLSLPAVFGVLILAVFLTLTALRLSRLVSGVFELPDDLAKLVDVVRLDGSLSLVTERRQLLFLISRERIPFLSQNGIDLIDVGLRLVLDLGVALAFLIGFLVLLGFLHHGISFPKSLIAFMVRWYYRILWEKTDGTALSADDASGFWKRMSDEKKELAEVVRSIARKADTSKFKKEYLFGNEAEGKDEGVSIENFFEHFFEKTEGSGCSADKARFVVRSLKKALGAGEAISFDAKYKDLKPEAGSPLADMSILSLSSPQMM